MMKYENIVKGIINVRFNQGFLINDKQEFLIDELKKALPEGTTFLSTLRDWDCYYLFGFLSISVAEIDKETKELVHEHYTITWAEPWSRLIEYMNKLVEGETVTW